MDDHNGSVEQQVSRPDVIDVMVVDNDPGDRVLLSAYLEKPRGAYSLSFAATLAVAVEKLRAKPCDIVLLDLGLPDSQGIDTFLRFRRLVPGLPVVVVTGLDDKEVALEAVRFGAQDYLIKGFTGSEVLARSLHFAVERHRIVQNQERERSERERLREMMVYQHLCAESDTRPDEPAGLNWRESSPTLFREISGTYGRLIALMGEVDRKSTEYHISETLAALADQLAGLEVLPEEVMEVHRSALFDICADEPEDIVKKYAEAGRFLLLELMGRLVFAYRGRGTGPTAARPTS